jgi:hypothetical protein
MTARYLHTMLRITDPARSRAFYEALGFEYRRDFDIVRNGEEATNYFFGMPGQEEELELTFNHDGRNYDLGTGYGHIAIGVDDLTRRWRASPSRTSSRNARRTRCVRAAAGCASCATRMVLVEVEYVRRALVSWSANRDARIRADRGPHGGPLPIVLIRSRFVPCQFVRFVAQRVRRARGSVRRAARPWRRGSAASSSSARR